MTCVTCNEFDDSAIWDELRAHEERIARLETLCSQMNTNISALQAIMDALKENDYVTNVAPIMENGKEIGYTITFKKSGSITIYHGKDGVDGSDGKDGTDGKDGSTPVIGVKQEEDGMYYWTLDGEWLLDEAGKKIPAVGKDGVDGEDGKDGVDGSAGVTPQLKVEDGYWYVSYDGGKTWQKLDKAVGEDGNDGKDSQDGEDASSMFTDIDVSNDDFIIITLHDGTQIKIPTWYAFEQLQALVDQMNANISALQAIVTALEENDYITSVVPMAEDDVVIGYKISFAKGAPIIIYHGEDGEDGQDGTNGTDGEDGHTPVIGVAQDDDGVYYWTVDGNWLVDENGEKIPTTCNDCAHGEAGNDGAPGQPGTNGADGVTPQLKIEDGLWYVSYDEGITWTEIGQATGEQGPAGETGPQGPQGDPGNDGDSFFQSVDTSNTDYIVFTLSDGTQIKIPTWTAFESLQRMCEQMNSNIEALQTIVNALQTNDYVVNVTPLYEGTSVIGYVINFSKSGPVTIYHGKDGQDGTPGTDGTDGTNGKDGYTPVIGVAKDTDGGYYWTVDGNWLVDASGEKIPTTGEDGAQGPQGTDGSNGQPGINGANGITPELKIENGLWFVSYDGGTTWTEIGQATGDQGPQGDAGENGDSFFQSVDTSSTDYVIFILNDGTEFKIPKYNGSAATLTLKEVTGFTATFDGTVIRKSLDLKVSVYYSTKDNLTVYNNKGCVSVSVFEDDTFTLRVAGLNANTKYYYFVEVVSEGSAKYTQIESFTTGEPDSYVDWENGETVEDEI